MEFRRDQTNEDELPEFTPDEVRILGFLADGISNSEIARQLDRNIGWLGYARRRIYKKLGVNDRFTAVIEAQGRDLIDRPDLTMQEALDIGRQAARMLLYKSAISSEELAIVNKYRALRPYMVKRIDSPDTKQSLAGTAFTFRAQGLVFAEFSKRAYALWPEIYSRIGSAAEAVADKSFILGAEYEARFNRTPE